MLSSPIGDYFTSTEILLSNMRSEISLIHHLQQDTSISFRYHNEISKFMDSNTI